MLFDVILRFHHLFYYNTSSGTILFLFFIALSQLSLFFCTSSFTGSSYYLIRKWLSHILYHLWTIDKCILLYTDNIVTENITYVIIICRRYTYCVKMNHNEGFNNSERVFQDSSVPRRSWPESSPRRVSELLLAPVELVGMWLKVVVVEGTVWYPAGGEGEKVEALVKKGLTGTAPHTGGEKAPGGHWGDGAPLGLE